MRTDENLFTLSFESEDTFNFPKIKPETTEIAQYIGFNYAKTTSDTENIGVHFFLDDYQFTRVWHSPFRYAAMLKRFACVFTPDFSIYTDMPKAMQIYNHYRKQWLGAYFQANLITTIPTVCWGDADTFQWCFKGIPTNSCVAVSSVGTQKDTKSKNAFLTGYYKMMELLTPTKILFYGSVPNECEGNIIQIDNFTSKFRKKV